MSSTAPDVVAPAGAGSDWPRLHPLAFGETDATVKGSRAGIYSGASIRGCTDDLWRTGTLPRYAPVPRAAPRGRESAAAGRQSRSAIDRRTRLRRRCGHLRHHLIATGGLIINLRLASRGRSSAGIAIGGWPSCSCRSSTWHGVPIGVVHLQHSSSSARTKDVRETAGATPRRRSSAARGRRPPVERRSTRCAMLDHSRDSARVRRSIAFRASGKDSERSSRTRVMA